MTLAVLSLALAVARLQPVDPDSVNQDLRDVVGPESKGPAVVRAQILLARSRFSPGQIDAVYGRNTEVAVLAFREANKLPSAAQVDGPVWEKLASPDPVIQSYTITDDDAGGPFTRIPRDMMQRASLKRLEYETLIEALGEKFHCSPRLLRLLNPKARFAAGEKIRVPNIAPRLIPVRAASIEVVESRRALFVKDDAGRVIAMYPATIGGEHDPLPVGEWKVTGIFKEPVFFYNPKLFWDADPAHSKARINPGPNNPAGLVWIGLSKQHYGIHGTPEPATVGKAQSHGCIRLTNWDALELAGMIEKNIPVVLKQ